MPAGALKFDRRQTTAGIARVAIGVNFVFVLVF
jgi:hypothetical protein